MSIFDGNILESANSLLNKGAEAVTRGIDTASTKMKQTDLTRQREAACAALGASLFEATRENAELRADREELFAAVEAIDLQIAEADAVLAAIEAEKAAKEAEKAAAAAEQATRESEAVCSICGSVIPSGALFCSNCGAKKPEPQPEPVPEPQVDLVCPVCGSSVASDALFCGTCGHKM